MKNTISSLDDDMQYIIVTYTGENPAETGKMSKKDALTHLEGVKQDDSVKDFLQMP